MLMNSGKRLENGESVLLASAHMLAWDRAACLDVLILFKNALIRNGHPSQTALLKCCHICKADWKDDHNNQNFFV